MRSFTLLPDDERRRSRRVATRCPLTLKWRDAVHRACAAVINEHGAMVLAPFTCPRGTVLELRSDDTGRTTTARVVWGWFGDSRPGSRFRLGLEFLDEAPGFWGEEYEQIASTREKPPRKQPSVAAR